MSIRQNEKIFFEKARFQTTSAEKITHNEISLERAEEINIFTK